MKLNFYVDELIMFHSMQRIVFIQTLNIEIEKFSWQKIIWVIKMMVYNRTHNISRFVGVLIELLLWLKGIQGCGQIYANVGICWTSTIWEKHLMFMLITSDSGQRQSRKTQGQQIVARKKFWKWFLLKTFQKGRSWNKRMRNRNGILF